MEKETKTEESKEVKKEPMRQIIIETDGNNLKIIKAEVAGNIELVGIFERLINFINKPKDVK